MSDSELLGAIPDFIAFPLVLKATPAEEGGARMLYMEASNEDPDHQNEIVLQKALADSSDYYLRHGNVDLSHYSLMGPKSGIPNFMEYEIGKPVEVRVDESKTFVKAELYQGDSAMARNANLVWDSLTKQAPPARWYPSVGGAVLRKSIKTDPGSGEQVAVVDKVRWSNLALDRCPVNKTVPAASLAPVGVFAKALGGFVLEKALTSGYGTDSAQLTGGGALRVQSLGGAVAATIPSEQIKSQSYLDFCDILSNAFHGRDATLPPTLTFGSLLDWVLKRFSMPYAIAAEWTERFLTDFDNYRLKNRRQ
jgi:hypothetical protein